MSEFNDMAKQMEEFEASMDDTILISRRQLLDAFAKASASMLLKAPGAFLITVIFGKKAMEILFDEDIKNESEETEDD